MKSYPIMGDYNKTLKGCLFNSQYNEKYGCFFFVPHMGGKNFVGLEKKLTGHGIEILGAESML